VKTLNPDQSINRSMNLKTKLHIFPFWPRPCCVRRYFQNSVRSSWSSLESDGGIIRRYWQLVINA